MLNKTNNNIFYYAFLLTSHSILLYLIIMIIYLILFIYFFADPILCQADEMPEVKELMDSTVSSKSGTSEPVANNLEGDDSEVSDKSSVTSVNERLLELNTLLERDRKECQVAHYEFHYWKNSLTRARQRSEFERNFELEKILCDNLDRSLLKGRHFVSKIRITEAGLKVLYPSYMSKMPKQWFE